MSTRSRFIPDDLSPHHDWLYFPGGAPVDTAYYWCARCGVICSAPSGDPKEFRVPGETAARTAEPQCISASVFAMLAAYVDEHHVGRDDDPNDIAKDIRDEIRSMILEADTPVPKGDTGP